MNEDALRKQVELLEQIVELQKQLLAEKGMSYPVYYPYVPFQPCAPFPYYGYEPHITSYGYTNTIPGSVLTRTA